MKKINILGINISTLKKQEVLNKIEHFLINGKQHYIITPNAEFILTARQDEEFFYILNKADLAVLDGSGPQFAALALGKYIQRFSGSDLTKEILKIAQDKKLKVAVLNWDKGLSKADDIKKALQKLYPSLQYIVEDIDREIPVETHCNASLREFHPDIIFITLGAPWQEKFIFHNLKNIPSAKLAIGVGGAFDFLTGKIKRALKLVRIIGLEWLWRLFKQPWRWKRIYKAVIIFPWEFFKWGFIKPFFYRPNVACLIYKKVGDKYKILLVERTDQPNHWQIPQGGLDGETIEKAARSEIQEETGIKNIRIASLHKNVYKYTIKQNHIEFWGRFRSSGYKGQKQSLVIAEFLGNDSEIKINYWDHSAWKWVDSERLISEVHPIRREAAKIFLEKFEETTRQLDS